ncbi:MAG TPA: fibronectin type III domain-containing protein [Myxococcales bacterium]|nr:fibronectin type III domain-containing protein [Myxococcales bacterium]
MARRPSVVLSVLLLAGCVFQMSDPQQGDSSKTLVGPEGGVVSLAGGPTLTIPAGALATPTEVSITQSAAVAPSAALTAVYVFSPATASFVQPATVSFPVPSGHPDVAVYWSTSSGAAQFQQMTTAMEGDRASAKVMKLGLGYAGAPPQATRTVSGALSTVFWQDDGTKTSRNGVVAPPMMRVSAIFVPKDDGYDVVRIVPAPDSSFSASGVPPGRYLLQIDTIYPPSSRSLAATYSQLVELTTSTPDLSMVVSARPDLQIAGEGSSPVTMSIANLTPWVPNLNGFTGDLIMIAGSQAHVYSRPGFGQIGSGMTAATLSFDWAAATTADRTGLPDASKRDVEYVYQRSTSPLGSGPTAGVERTATRFQRLDSLTIGAAGSTSFQVALADAPSTAVLHADLRNSQFAALLPQINPYAVPSSTSGGVSVLAVPHSIAFPDSPSGGASTSLLWVQGPATLDIDYGAMTYGQFLPPLWQEMQYVYYSADITAPGTSSPYWSGALLSMLPVPATGPIAPALSPPLSPKIQGRDAFVPQSGVSEVPLISWSPPSLGTATSYVVRIDPVDAGDFQEVAITVYSGTSVRIPAGFLHLGRQYAATITAVSAPWDKLDRPPLRTGAPVHMADCVSAIFTL